MNKKQRKKRALCFLLSGLIVFFAVFSTVDTRVQAKNWTKKAVQKELKKAQATLKSQNKKYNSMLKEYEKKREGIIGIVGAKVISGNPLIIYYNGLLGPNDKGYYWIKEGKENYDYIFNSASLKLTGEVENFSTGYSIITCSVAKCVKTDGSATKLLKQGDKVSKTKEKISNLKGALKNKPDFKIDEYYALGETYNLRETLTWKYDDPYSKVKWKSSNKKIATISEKGVLTTKKPGKVKITATSSISGKKTTKTILVYNVYNIADSLKLLREDYRGIYMTLKDKPDKIIITMKSNLSSPTPSFTSSNTKVVTVSADGTLTPVSSGEAIVTIDVDGLWVEIIVWVEKPEEAPRTEAPRTEAPRTEAPRTEAPSTQAPSTEVPSTLAPISEQPTSERPSTEAPSTEQWDWDDSSWDW